MSYILDALKRADAERERGHVPGLHTHTAPVTDTNGGQATSRYSRPWLALAATALVLAGVVAWLWRPEAAPVMVAPPSPAAPGTRAPTPAPAVTAAPLTEPPAAPAPPTLSILSPEPPHARPDQPADSDTGGAAPVTPVPAAPVSTADITGGSGPSGNTIASPTVPTPVRSFAELSPEVRARLPAVSVTGSTYSQNPAHRMLIVNGKVVQEGEDIAPGLKLVSIGPHDAVLDHQGLRYRIGY